MKARQRVKKSCFLVVGLFLHCASRWCVIKATPGCSDFLFISVLQKSAHISHKQLVEAIEMNQSLRKQNGFCQGATSRWFPFHGRLQTVTLHHKKCGNIGTTYSTLWRKLRMLSVIELFQAECQTSQSQGTHLCAEDTLQAACASWLQLTSSCLIFNKNQHEFSQWQWQMLHRAETDIPVVLGALRED